MSKNHGEENRRDFAKRIWNTELARSPIRFSFDEAEKLLKRYQPKPRKPRTTYPNNKLFRNLGLSTR